MDTYGNAISDPSNEQQKQRRRWQYYRQLRGGVEVSTTSVSMIKFEGRQSVTPTLLSSKNPCWRFLSNCKRWLGDSMMTVFQVDYTQTFGERLWEITHLVSDKRPHKLFHVQLFLNKNPAPKMKHMGSELVGFCQGCTTTLFNWDSDDDNPLFESRSSFLCSDQSSTNHQVIGVEKLRFLLWNEYLPFGAVMFKAHYGSPCGGATREHLKDNWAVCAAKAQASPCHTRKQMTTELLCLNFVWKTFASYKMYENNRSRFDWRFCKIPDVCFLK